ncbi:MAG: 2-amino-3,7-dideoxy-D-threo-hept-6-ulosonate synthase [Nitrososphaeria archaeon]|nr:2-amino-3,7-dideoxy-D-threo-hept-6-ulosonate synthase [Nitrososphaeria archaeon]MDW8021165.1 2-amino-3,7-dideoxy-D-threo-hept-6-ulosonate synthase [Nitrososphaerota archaeon]
MVWGKDVRLSRVLYRGRMLCVPMDHGVSSGPMKGIDRIHDTIRKVDEGGVTAIIVHKGIIKSLPKPIKAGLIMHASGSTSLSTSPNWKVLVGTVEEAIRLGADAVSLHINIGNKDEQSMLSKLGMVADECDEWGMPLIAMMYPRGENVKNPNDPEVIAHVARVGAELGADVVKVPMPSSNPDEIRLITGSCPVPVVAAGGPKMDDDVKVLELAHAVIEAGGAGVTFGRNIFQHERPDVMVRALRAIIIDGRSIEEALEILRGTSK